MALPDGIATDPRYKHRISPISSIEDIPVEWRNSPIEELINLTNFDQPIAESDRPRLLISSCIDFRFSLNVPHGFAYVIRTAGGRLIGSEFSIAYALSRGVRHIALVGHNDCGMTQVPQHAAPMVAALAAEGWDKDRAEEYVNVRAARHAISDEIDSLEREYRRLKSLFHKVCIAPLLACLADKKLYLPAWYNSNPYAGSKHSEEISDQELVMLE